MRCERPAWGREYGVLVWAKQRNPVHDQTESVDRVELKDEEALRATAFIATPVFGAG